MSFDYATTEQQILDRLTAAAASAGIPLYRDEDTVDLTDNAVVPVGAQVVFLDIYPVDQAGPFSMHNVLFAFDLYLDSGRVSAAQKSAAATLFGAAMNALVGWNISPGRSVLAEKVQRSSGEGRIRRRSFGFTIPVFTTG